MPGGEAGGLLRGIIPRGDEKVRMSLLTMGEGCAGKKVAVACSCRHSQDSVIPNMAKLFSESSPHSTGIGANSLRKKSAPHLVPGLLWKGPKGLLKGNEKLISGIRSYPQERDRNRTSQYHKRP